MKNLRQTAAYDDTCGKAGARNQKGEKTAYKLFVQKATSAAFYRETFKRGCGKSTTWVRAGAVEKITLENAGRIDAYIRLK